MPLQSDRSDAGLWRCCGHGSTSHSPRHQWCGPLIPETRLCAGRLPFSADAVQQTPGRGCLNGALDTDALLTAGRMLAAPAETSAAISDAIPI